MCCFHIAVSDCVIRCRRTVTYEIDFSKEQAGDGHAWAKKNGFEYAGDGKKMKLTIKDGRLNIVTEKGLFGVVQRPIDAKNADTVRIEWGADKYPAADYDAGEFREAVQVFITFGKKKFNSGSVFIPNLPPSQYHKDNGRYICPSPCTKKEGETLVTEINLKELFKKTFGTDMPPVSGIGFEVDSRDTDQQKNSGADTAMPDYRLISEGSPDILGATVTENGVNFAVFSATAERVDICIFDPADGQEKYGWLCLTAPGMSGTENLAAYLPECITWAPQRGLWFNPHKLLIDPYARALTGIPKMTPALLGYVPGSEGPIPVMSETDSAPYMPKGIIGEFRYPYTSSNPRTPLHRTVIYETHLKSFTARHAKIDPAQRGKITGFNHPEILNYLHNLGITAVEFLPVQSFASEFDLQEKGLVNYWGYNPLNYFSVHPPYVYRDGAEEYTSLVNSLHNAGIEVIMDVVYNHTAEIDHLGPHYSFRGIDNRSYYLTDPENPMHYVNDAACGNVLNAGHPQVLKLIIDSLRHWAMMGVDGFRFDLSVIISKTGGKCKMIHEPWDSTPDGYVPGQFPPGNHEWNDRFKNTVRQTVRRDKDILRNFAHCACNKYPVNYITAHDGFTLADLTSYNAKHNTANGHDNTDGEANNYSYNHGYEGITSDEVINAARLKSQRYSMINGGDELLRTLHGNNNAYCQDNEVNYYDWNGYDAESTPPFFKYVRRLISLRKEFSHFTRSNTQPALHIVIFCGLHRTERRCGRNNGNRFAG
ncbi:hypothetical protein CHS0354_001936 [Potamilus streckersoni]|uniref:Glycosyl hydrolase family 13 catalytic domain-containing protein n=1 Tax=Potamilus streckersoni TaxID=2493646 RepID=A0AAE0T693_9BIVA|nr:hypothetical protein CHS0354_001936 [Potamilus streckersoni]